MSPSQGRLKVGEAEMAWICAEEGERIYWTPASQEGRGRPQRRLMDVVMKDVEERNCSVFSPQIKNWKLFFIVIILNRIKVLFCPLVKQERKYRSSPQRLKATTERSYLGLNQRPSSVCIKPAPAHMWSFHFWLQSSKRITLHKYAAYCCTQTLEPYFNRTRETETKISNGLFEQKHGLYLRSSFCLVSCAGR